jgi:hypothetical protein
VAAAHQVADLAFGLGPRCPVVSPPGRVGLGLPGGGQPGLVRADGDRGLLWRWCTGLPAGRSGRPRRTWRSRRAARWRPGWAR